MEDRNFSFYKTLYLTRRNSYELPQPQKDYYQKFGKFNPDFNGEIELGKRYRIEVFEVIEPWNLKTEEYLHFFESHKENLIGAQVKDVDFFDLDDCLKRNKWFEFKKDEEDLWIDSSKKRQLPCIWLQPPQLFYFWLGLISPDFDANHNYVFLFYPFKEGTENLYEPLLVEEKKIPPEVKHTFYDHNENEYSLRNCRDFFSENYLGNAEIF